MLLFSWLIIVEAVRSRRFCFKASDQSDVSTPKEEVMRLSGRVILYTACGCPWLPMDCITCLSSSDPPMACWYDSLLAISSISAITSCPCSRRVLGEEGSRPFSRLQAPSKTTIQRTKKAAVITRRFFTLNLPLLFVIFCNQKFTTIIQLCLKKASPRRENGEKGPFFSKNAGIFILTFFDLRSILSAT